MRKAHLKTLVISKLLAFKRISVNFSPGITVIIGANSTGKTHLMKLAYAMIKSVADYHRNVDNAEGQNKPHVTNKLLAVFRPDDRQIGRLVHRSVGQSSGWARLHLSDGGEFRVDITRKGQVRRRLSAGASSAIFIPSREVLSIYPGFAFAYENRELAFDETYYDLCKALSGPQLRGPRAGHVAALINPIIAVLGGKVTLDGDRFLLKSKSGNLEAPLLSEGFRKLGALAHLVANGSLTGQSVLFWDEPEANLNPRMVTLVATMLRTLAAQGTQIIIATHDFLLTQELSLAAEHQTEPRVPMSFVALSRSDDGSEVTAQTSDTLVGLRENAILAEFAAHYDREQRLIADSISGGGST